MSHREMESKNPNKWVGVSRGGGGGRWAAHCVESAGERGISHSADKTWREI